MSEVSLFDSPAENPLDVEGPTVAALLGDGSPVRTEPAPGHIHEWAAPRRATTGGWYTECKSCTAWWADPSPMLPVAVPAYMTVPDDVVYPPAVPSNTVDARPPAGDAGVDVGERCPSCGVRLPDPKHLVHAALSAGEPSPEP